MRMAVSNLQTNAARQVKYAPEMDAALYLVFHYAMPTETYSSSSAATMRLNPAWIINAVQTRMFTGLPHSSSAAIPPTSATQTATETLMNAAFRPRLAMDFGETRVWDAATPHRPATQTEIPFPRQIHAVLQPNHASETPLPPWNAATMRKCMLRIQQHS